MVSIVFVREVGSLLQGHGAVHRSGRVLQRVTFSGTSVVFLCRAPARSRAVSES